MNWEAIKRGNLFMNWEDIILVQEVEISLTGSGGYKSNPDVLKRYVEENPWKKLNEKIGEEKTDRFIKIYCTVNNIDYEKNIKLNEDIKVTVNGMQKVFESIKVKVNVQK